MLEILEGSVVADQRELREMTELGRREGVVEEEEHDLVERAFRMDELTTWDIMTPRVDIFAWPDSLTVGEVVPTHGCRSIVRASTTSPESSTCERPTTLS
jgi:CBS domain containing-hemolysin-like protein